MADEARHVADVARLFLRLGFTAFGGPAAHIAMMEDEVVRRGRWMTREEFTDLLGAANLIPGPSSTELAIYIGHKRAGAIGLVLAGVCFILPAALMTGALAWAYQRAGQVPEIGSVLYGLKPVVIAIVLQAIFRLAPIAAKKPSMTGALRYLLPVVGTLAAVASVFGVHELAVLGGAGLLVALVKTATLPRPSAKDGAALLGGMKLASGAAAALVPASVLSIFLVFLKIGAIAYGSGYVLLAFLRNDLVERTHWLGEQQLLDAVAVGQLTPGPVFTTATFIGYLLGDVPGAALATLGIFLPGFLLVAASSKLIPRIRRSPVMGAFLDGVNVASIALMAVVSWQLGRAAIVDVVTAVIAGASLVLLAFRVRVMWLLGGGAVAGLLAATLA